MQISPRTRSYPPPCGEGGEHAGKLAQPAQAWLRCEPGGGPAVMFESRPKDGPHPQPPPQGGGEHTESAALIPLPEGCGHSGLMPCASTNLLQFAISLASFALSTLPLA